MKIYKKNENLQKKMKIYKNKNVPLLNCLIDIFFLLLINNLNK